VARSNPGGVIGCENTLPWKLRTDMKFFRSVTENHVVIMGRKTLDSLGRPLPKRLNIVISSKPGIDTDNLFWASSPENALFIADFLSILHGMNKIIVIGGAQIYKAFKDQFTRIYLTEVFHEFPCGDAYFDEKFNLREWDLISKTRYEASELDEFDFEISILDRKRRFTRHRQLSEFYVNENLDKLRNDFDKFSDRFCSPRPDKADQIKLPLKVA
jgi:dihydrofolate reductase